MCGKKGAPWESVMLKIECPYNKSLHPIQLRHAGELNYYTLFHRKSSTLSATLSSHFGVSFGGFGILF
jgi:hypothetical protein